MSANNVIVKVLSVFVPGGSSDKAEMIPKFRSQEWPKFMFFGGYENYIFVSHGDERNNHPDDEHEVNIVTLGQTKENCQKCGESFRQGSHLENQIEKENTDIK